MSSPHNGSGYYGLKEEINDVLSREHFRTTLSGAGDTSVEYARTGYLGFLMKSGKTDRNGGGLCVRACVRACVRGTCVRACACV